MADSGAAAAASDGTHWRQTPVGAGGDPIWVDLRFALYRVNAVDTVAGTAYVHIMPIMYWTDQRLVGWPWDMPLPPSLWGPELDLENKLGDLEREQFDFALVKRSTTGRLKRVVSLRGTIDNPMHVETFPFDLDTIDFTYQSYSNWRSLDGTLHGLLCTRKNYRLRQICEEGEGHWIDLRWHGSITEWRMHGISSQIKEWETTSSGTEKTSVIISLHVSRKSGYYFWKALLPLYLLTTLSMSTFHFPCNDLANRVGTVSTY
eukprot:COSAG01_NODE_18719_length_1058_cov_0.792492_1_plen_260_part_01